MIEEVVESKFTYDDVLNKLNAVNFFENIKQQEKIESLFFKHENQFIIINLSSIENLINGANEFIYSCFGTMPSDGNLPSNIIELISDKGSILNSSFVIDLTDASKNLLNTISRYQLLSKLVAQKTNSLVESKNSIFQNFNHALNQGDSDTALYLLERLSKYLSAKNLISLKIKYFHTFRRWSDILEMDEFINIVKTSRTSKTTETILEALYFELPEEVWSGSLIDYVKETYNFNLIDFVKPHLLLLKSKESLAVLKKVLDENNQTELFQSIEETEAFNYFDNTTTSSIKTDEKDIKSLIESGDYGLALDLIDLESDKYEDVFLQTVLALKIEDQDIKEEIFKNIVSINKKQRNEFLKEPAFKENFTILQKSIYSDDENSILFESWSELLLKLDTLSYPIENLIEESYQIWNEQLSDNKFKESLLTALKKTNSDKLISYIFPYLTLGIIYSNEDSLNVNIAVELLKKINPSSISETNVSGDIYDLYKLIIESELLESESINELFFPHWNNGLKYNTNPIDIISFLNLYKSKYQDNYLLLLIKSDKELLHTWLSTLSNEDQMLLIEILDYEYEIQIDTKLKTSGCECYENKKIVLYSLDLNSVKIFQNEITKKCPKVKINFRQDLKGGDSSLKGAVQNADVVFMVVAAAQHSATNFIEDHIGANDLVKINRKGVTALRNAFEEWCSSQ